jgi:hypothetical protein
VTHEEQHRELHDHYARNALARGHAPGCPVVTGAGGRVWTGVPVNWPTIFGRPACTCPRGAW